MKTLFAHKKTTVTTNTAALFTRPEVTNTWLTITDVENAKANLLMTSKITNVLNKTKDVVAEYAFRMFIEMDTAKVVNMMNNMHAMEEHLQVEIGKLAYKLIIRKNDALTTFDQAKVAPTCAFMILQALMDTGVITTEVKVLSEINETTGRKVWRHQTFLTFGMKAAENVLYVKGLSLEPTVIQKKTKVRTGGKSVKLSRVEKTFLKDASSTPMRLIDINPEEIGEYLKETSWYLKALKGTDKLGVDHKDREVDVLVLDSKVNKQVAKFRLMQTLPSFYLPMWLDYRTRMYYELSELGFNPHGKTFETALYELAEARTINASGFRSLAYQAVAIVDGRTPHDEAIATFEANPAHYLAELRTDAGERGKNLYNTRVAQAIEDFYNETPSHFLLGEDATNGGMQHGGIGFRAEKMMFASNVGGSLRQEDSHGVLQATLGLKTRDEAKDIHQPLLHGSSLATVAVVMGKDQAETKAMMIAAYGREVLNIQAIAEWGTNVISNHATSLMWTTRDGFKAQSIAYSESVPLTIYALTPNTKSGYTEVKIQRDMPMKLDRKGQPIFGAVGGDKTMGGANKLRGLYANITHSIDATGLRDVIRAVIEHNLNDAAKTGLWKHDNFLMHANDMEAARAGYKASLLANFDYESYDMAIKQIATALPKGTMTPVLTKGNGTKEMIEKSEFFLAA